MAANQQPQQYPEPMMTRAQAAEMLRLQRRADRRGGCLMFVLWTFLFGVFYWTWLAIKWTAIGSLALCRVGWALFVAYPVKWGIAGAELAWVVMVAATRWTVKGVQVAAPLALAAMASLTATIRQRNSQPPQVTPPASPPPSTQD
jgi:hypothetical protein